MRTRTEVARLSARYRRLVTLLGAAALLLLGVLIAREFVASMEASLRFAETRARERLTAVEAVVRIADQHVAGLRAQVERDLALGRAAPAGSLPPLPASKDERPVDWLAEPSAAEAHRRGSLVVVPSRAAGRATFGVDAAAALDLFVASGAAHAGNAFLKWSYFFSAGRDLVAIHPWLDVVGTGPKDAAPLTVFDSYFDYDVYRLVTPEADPNRAAVWVPVYFDAGNAGLMVSHNAPVTVNGAFRGMVGTDILLASLSGLVRAEGRPGLSTVLVDQAGMVVADSTGVAARAGRLTPATELLPVTPQEIRQGQFDRFGWTYARTYAVAGTPWTAVLLVSGTDVLKAAALEVLPYCIVLVMLAAILTVGFMVIARQFVQPALQLARNVERLARGEAALDQPVPAIWKPWTDRVLGVFAELQGTLDRLHRAETKSAAVIDVALDAVVTTDAAGRVVDFNPAAEAMFGYGRAEIVGRSLGETIVPEAMRGAHEAGMRRHAETGVSHVLGRRVELEARHASGRVFPVEIQIHALRTGGEVAYAAYIRDLTARRAAEAEIALQRERLHVAEKDAALGSLLAGVAHELNNPLAVVTAQATLLEVKVVGTPFAERVGKIRAAADRCGRIVKGFLAMAKRKRPARRPVDLDECVRSALEMVAYGVRSAGIAVETDFAGDLAAVPADPDQIIHIVANLVINAQHALAAAPEPRRIRVATRREAARSLVIVEDNGPGVPEALQARIFEPYFTTKPLGAGTGIGLSVSRDMALAHGGDLHHEPRPEGGARFVLALPPPETDAVRPVRSAEPGRILIVDDEPEVAASLAEMLELIGARTVSVGSVEAGLAAALEGSFAAVFSDLHMPGGGGLALFGKLAAEGPAGLRLVLVTGDTVSAAASVGLAGLEEVVTVIEKPFTLAELRRLWAEIEAA